MATVTISTAKDPSAWFTGWTPQGRPWVALYGLRVKLSQEVKEVALAPIQKLIPEEVLLKIFETLPPYTLGRVACVCKQWSELTRHSFLWEGTCKKYHAADSPEKLEQQFKLYKYNWREMFLKRPHVRFDGLYVSRNTYIRTGITEWRIKNPVHLVTYFRYLRMWPDGRFLTRTSPEVVSKVERTMLRIPEVVKPDDTVHVGRWALNKNALRTDFKLPNKSETEIRTLLKLRSTVQGANNRLDVEKILSYERDGSALSLTDALTDDEIELQGAQHHRGLSTFIFIPDEEIATHVFNQDASKMDYFLPG